MSARPYLRRGWCPGALRPMESGDGLIVRVRPRGGELTAGEARALARTAREYGNGIIELTRRAGLQLRGVSATTLPEVHRVLDRLGFLDESPEAEVRRNILGNPLAGLDPDCCDIRPILHALERRLACVEACNGLPAKFGFVVDGGGRLPLREENGDIRFDAGGDHWVRVGAGGNAATAALLGWCRIENVPEIAARLVSVFVARRTAEMSRMRAFISENGTASLMNVLEGLLGEDRHNGLKPERPADFIGLGIIDDKAAWFGAALPLGSGRAMQLAGLAALSDRFGDGKIRITPWRSVILPLEPCVDMKALVLGAAELGLVTEPGDPRRFLVACPGAPSCRSAQGTTRDLASAIAVAAPALLDGSLGVHVSGCIKSCACSGPAGIALTAQGGFYRLGFASAPGSPRETEPLAFDGVLDRLTALADRYAKHSATETAASFLACSLRQKTDIP